MKGDNVEWTEKGEVRGSFEFIHDLVLFKKRVLIIQ